MYPLCKRIAESAPFERAVVFLILANAAVMGFETSITLTDQYGDTFFLILWVSQFIFVAEILVRIIGYGPKFRTFFGEFWNLFDFVIVAASLLPAVGPFVVVARVLRVLRILRLMTVSDRLRAVLNSLRHTLDEALQISLIAIVFLYVFAISGFHLFSELDPARWGSLLLAIRTLLFLVLLQDIPEIVAAISQFPLSSTLYLLLFAFTVLYLLLNAIGVFAAEHLSQRQGARRD